MKLKKSKNHQFIGNSIHPCIFRSDVSSLYSTCMKKTVVDYIPHP